MLSNLREPLGRLRFRRFTLQQICPCGHAGSNYDGVTSEVQLHPAVVEATWCWTWTHTGSVVVEALAGLLEVTVTFLRWGESQLGQVLPVQGAAAQLSALSLGPSPLDIQQLDVAGKGDSPGSQVPRYVLPHCHRPGHTGWGRVIVCTD